MCMRTQARESYHPTTAFSVRWEKDHLQRGVMWWVKVNDETLDRPLRRTEELVKDKGMMFRSVGSAEVEGHLYFFNYHKSCDDSVRMIQGLEHLYPSKFSKVYIFGHNLVTSSN